jgi:hypothetical protein
VEVFFAISRTIEPYPQEAIIGIVYAVSAAAAVLVWIERHRERASNSFCGSILTVTLRGWDPGISVWDVGAVH